ncbi:hypothetical protein BGZ60DRAFT_170432 [Tricladium varicosporioides]|nr:hypothetical protein BGZ60DRAFT_170432 [Hymenoscyphus varicosporioides]
MSSYQIQCIFTTDRLDFSLNYSATNVCARKTQSTACNLEMVPCSNSSVGRWQLTDCRLHFITISNYAVRVLDACPSHLSFLPNRGCLEECHRSKLSCRKSGLKAAEKPMEIILQHSTVSGVDHISRMTQSDRIRLSYNHLSPLVYSLTRKFLPCFIVTQASESGYLLGRGRVHLVLES